jgi:hypothetical protein
MPPTLPSHRFLPKQQAQHETLSKDTPAETPPTDNGKKRKQPSEDFKKPHRFNCSWVCCKCRFCFGGLRQPESYCARCSHQTGREKCAECSDMVYFMESERHLVDALPNQYQPVETGWFCARNQCDRYYKDDKVFPKYCFWCWDIGPLFGFGRRVVIEVGSALEE